MKGKRILSWLLTQPVTTDAVRALDDGDLCEVTGYVSQDYDENGVTGALLGICLVESAMRFAALQKGRGTAEQQRSQRDAEQEQGEGFL